MHFVHTLSDDAEAMTLSELHQAVEDYINRDDQELLELASERKQRNWRKTEGKTKREIEIEKQKEAESEEYKAGVGKLQPVSCAFATER